MTEEERKALKIYCFQRCLIGSQVYGDAFIEKVKKAFADVPYPDLEFFAGSAEHNPKCDECREANDYFKGRKLENCLDNDEASRRLGNGFVFFHDSVWHYFLPAYLIKLVNQGRFATQEFRPLMQDESPELKKGEMEQINLLSAKQCAVIVNYLEITLKVWEGIENNYQDDPEPLIFWKENYEKALAREENFNK